MIDYIKIQVLNTNPKIFSNNPLLSFEYKVMEDTGELSTKKIAVYNYLKFTIWDSGTIKMQGSLHKYWNAKQTTSSNKSHNGFNGNDFNYDKLIEVLNDLEQLFNVSLDKTIIENIEFGVNIRPPIATSLILKNLLFHKSDAFDSRYKGSLREIIRQQYVLKVYNKAKQYNLKNPLMRVEVKILKSHLTKPLGLKSLNDLRKDKVRNQLLEEIIKRWNEIMLFDPTIKFSKLTNRRKIKHNEYSNTNYWTSLNPNHKHRHKKIYKMIVKLHSNETHQKVAELIKEKWSMLNEKVCKN